MIARAFERVYSLLLYAYPPDLRRAHGADMRQCVRATLAARGLAAVPRLLADLSISLPHEWALAFGDLSLKGLLMIGIGRDVGYAIRLLWRSPGFTIAAVLTLSLGIGANAAIFSLADATLLRTIRVQNPAQLFSFHWSASYPEYLEYAARTDLFTGVLATAGSPRLNVTVNGASELVNATFVSGNYFGVLGVSAAAGRVLVPSDDVRNGPIAAVINDTWWRSRFARDPSIVGRMVQVNGQPVMIVGVAAREFTGTSLYTPPQLFLPLNSTQRIRTGFFSRARLFDNADFVWLGTTARLREGISVAAAADAVNAMYARLHPPAAGQRPDANELTPLKRRAMGGSAADVYRFVLMLVGVVGLTLLIGCANLANLLLARGAARRREIGLRMAVGAGRLQVARQLLVESLVLAGAGGVASLYVAAMTLKLVGRFQLPGGVDIENLRLGLSPWAIAFTATVSLVTGILFGMAPALRASRADVLESLREDSRGVSSRSRLRSTLVAAQIALSLVLLTGTGLFLRSLRHSLDAHLGYTVDGVASVSVNLGTARYEKSRAQAFYEEALIRVRGVPGVTAAAWTNLVPVNGLRMFNLGVEGYTKRGSGDSMRFYNASVGPDYFQAVGTRLIKGRAFSDADTAAAPHVAIVNETAARHFWDGRDPLQGRLQLAMPGNGGTDAFQVVGVVEDTIVQDLDEPPGAYVYLPFAQSESGGTVDPAHLFVRTRGDVAALLPQIRTQLLGRDASAPIYDVTTFDWHLRKLVMPQRMGATLFGIFSLLALALASVGIYGVASYVAALRTREMGIRIALGADPTGIRALVIRDAAGPIAAGLAAGLAIALLASRLAAAFLRGVTPRDPLTYGAAALLLALTAFAATWLPARRAARLDPIRALRQD